MLPAEDSAGSTSPTKGDDGQILQWIEQQLPALRRFVQLRTGPELRAHEACSDLVQSVYRELLEDLPRLSFVDEAAFRGWLFRAARNKVAARARHLHQQRRDVRRVVQGPGADEAELGAAPGDSPSGLAATAEEIEQLERAFDQLSDDHREVLTLARLRGLPLAEVGARMGGRSQAAITMLLGRAMGALDAVLQRDRPRDPPR
jgi:RNA polymerase sigma factor (sigma-70 family)